MVTCQELARLACPGPPLPLSLRSTILSLLLSDVPAPIRTNFLDLVNNQDKINKRIAVCKQNIEIMKADHAANRFPWNQSFTNSEISYEENELALLLRLKEFRRRINFFIKVIRADINENRLITELSNQLSNELYS